MYVFPQIFSKKILEIIYCVEPSGSEAAKFRLWVKSKGLQLAPSSGQVDDKQDFWARSATCTDYLISPFVRF